MTGPELSRTLQALGWSYYQIATWTGWAPTTIRRMMQGHRNVEPALASWLRRAEAWRERNPPPQRPQRGAEAD